MIPFCLGGGTGRGVWWVGGGSGGSSPRIGHACPKTISNRLLTKDI
jgi:hypothetical protein